MFLPPQGFRHAATLLLTNGCRALPADAPAESVTTALLHLARELAALADDMRAAPESAEWLLAEYARTLERLPHAFDRARARDEAAAILSRVSARRPAVEPRDVFLVYVPEDRLPVAAPLAVELTKRRVSVALSEYEVATSDELAAALDRGLRHHRAGIVLYTGAFARRGWAVPGSEDGRIRVIRDCDPIVACADLATWLRRSPL